jgi:formate dehydrogenase gamma subunit
MRIRTRVLTQSGWLFLLFLLCLCAANVSAQHPPITLLDKDGEEINPMSGDNADKPFSTEQTCGLCHDYEEITSGFHFQMGWNVADDNYGVEYGRPWDVSNGFLGRWYPYAFRQLAKKVNQSPDQIDLTVYDFVGFSSPGPGQLPCGACHPGGGGLQYDRNGNRYDEQLTADSSLSEQLDGDYYKSKWDKSGVVEADCFICHLAGYNFTDRVAQLEQGNYRWATVAGSRLGIVEGSVAQGSEPTVKYNRRFFNEDGTITLDISWPPPDDNCVYCHGKEDVKKRGFSWNDIFNPDVHNQQAVSCTACHPAGPDHQLAMGNEAVSHVAPELTNTIKNCRECHESGYLGAPVPGHTYIRPSHLERLTCESCHIPKLHRSAALGVDATTGELVFRSNPPTAGGSGEKAEWEPVYERYVKGIVYPFNSVLTIWWGNRDTDGLVYPLFLREHKAGWQLFADQVTDDDGDGNPEVNTRSEITAGLKAFAQSLQGNQRFSRIQPVLIKAETAWELDAAGNLVSASLTGTPLEGASYVNFSISHQVAPTRSTLGAGGCGDCHSNSANFFKGQRIVDLYGEDGKPVTRSMGSWLGCDPISLAINTFHQQIISPYVGPVIIMVLFLIVVHYHSYGPKRITFDPYSQEIQRFSLLERAVHLVRLVSFVILSVTGLILAFNLRLWQELIFSSPKQMLDIHIWSGVLFIISTVLGVWMWFKDALFASYDKHWMKMIGGYLGYKGEIPAGRFNAGQKMFYWYTTIFGVIMGLTGVVLIFKNIFTLSTILIMSTVHNVFGFVMIAGVLAHAYLGTIANPGTWRVLVDGSVTKEWAHHHHPYWYRRLMAERETADQADESKTEGNDRKSETR